MRTGRVIETASDDEVRSMAAGWKIFLLFAAVFALALGAERLFVPYVVPVAFAEEPQPLWSVETAFVLRAIELMSGGVAIIALVLTLSAWAKQLSGHGAD
jgi:hypothetical protein